jgi:hypothetical protein
LLFAHLDQHPKEKQSLQPEEGRGDKVKWIAKAEHRLAVELRPDSRRVMMPPDLSDQRGQNCGYQNVGRQSRWAKFLGLSFEFWVGSPISGFNSSVALGIRSSALGLPLLGLGSSAAP